MRPVCRIFGICMLFAALVAGNAFAVGLHVPGKEVCRCSTAATTGATPDLFNELAQTPGLASLRSIVDRLAGEIKAILGQFGVESQHVWKRPESTVATEVVPAKGTTEQPRKKRRLKFPATKK